MGTLDQPSGSNVVRKIKYVDVTPYSPAQVETYYNDNYGDKGWRIIQVVVLGSNRYIVAEKEY